MIQYKLVNEISLNFPDLFVIGKYVKIRFKNKGSPYYFLSSRGQKIKNITKIEQKRLFLFTFLVPFFMALLAQKLIYTINIWFNFVACGWESSEGPIKVFSSWISLRIFFDDINHGNRAAILKKNSLWLLPFYMAVATYCYYEKVRRMMRTAIVSYLLNWIVNIFQDIICHSNSKIWSPLSMSI